MPRFVAGQESRGCWGLVVGLGGWVVVLEWEEQRPGDGVWYGGGGAAVAGGVTEAPGEARALSPGCRG